MPKQPPSNIFFERQLPNNDLLIYMIFIIIFEHELSQGLSFLYLAFTIVNFKKQFPTKLESAVPDKTFKSNFPKTDFVSSSAYYNNISKSTPWPIKNEVFNT